MKMTASTAMPPTVRKELAMKLFLPPKAFDLAMMMYF